MNLNTDVNESQYGPCKEAVEAFRGKKALRRSIEDFAHTDFKKKTMLTKIMLEHIPAPAAEVWRNEYRGRRYLRRLGIGELRARLMYLAKSLTALRPDGRFGLLGQEVPLWQAFAETCEEAALRSESVDELLKGVEMPDSEFSRTVQTLGLPADQLCYLISG